MVYVRYTEMWLVLVLDCFGMLLCVICLLRCRFTINGMVLIELKITDSYSR